MIKTLQELAKEAEEAGDANVAIVLYALTGSMQCEYLGALYELAILAREHAIRIAAKLGDRNE